MKEPMKRDLRKAIEVNRGIKANILSLIKAGYQENPVTAEFLRHAVDEEVFHGPPKIQNAIGAFLGMRHMVMQLGTITLQEAFFEWMLNGEVEEPAAVEMPLDPRSN